MSDTVNQIIKVMGASREMAGYRTFSSNDLDKLKILLNKFKEEIKQEVKEELSK